MYFGTKLDISGENTLIIIFTSFFINKKKINFKSNAGDCVIFDQRILHAGGILKGNQPKYSIFLSYGIKNSHSRNHKNFYLSRPTYTKKIPNKLRQKLKRKIFYSKTYYKILFYLNSSRRNV